jgi:hypothetical protein
MHQIFCLKEFLFPEEVDEVDGDGGQQQSFSEVNAVGGGGIVGMPVGAAAFFSSSQTTTDVKKNKRQKRRKP